MPPLQLATEETFGHRLARLRKEKGFTQVELAERVGINQVLVSDYERDRLRLNAEMICRFAKALSVTSDVLLGLAGSRAMKPEGKISLKLIRRLQRLEKLPSAKQKALLQTIDGFLRGEGIAS